MAGKVRAAKSREAALRQEGMTGQRAGRAAAASVATVKKAPKQAKKARSSKAAAPNEKCASCAFVCSYLRHQLLRFDCT